MAEDLGAEIEHDFLSGPLHEVGLEELEGVGEEQGGEVEEAEFGDASHGARAEVAGEPRELCAGGVVHVGVDGDLDEIWADDIGGGFEDDSDAGEGGLELVGAQVGEEAAHEASVVGLADHVFIGGGLFLGLGLDFGLRCWG